MEETIFKPANKSTLHDDIMAQMLEAISEGTWEPGARLPGEQALASQFCVSRNCIREVLKALALSGIVESRAGNGTFISQNALRSIHSSRLVRTMMDETSLRELMEARCLIEGQVAYWATLRASDEEIEELGAILRLNDEPTIRLSDHAEFHRKMYQMARNNLLYRFLESIQGEMNYSRQHFSEWTKDRLMRSAEQHRQIYDMMAARDADGARRCMEEHIRDSHEEWILDIEGGNPAESGI